MPSSDTGLITPLGKFLSPISDCLNDVAQPSLLFWLYLCKCKLCITICGVDSHNQCVSWHAEPLFMSLCFVLTICLAYLFGMQLGPHPSDQSLCIWQNSHATITVSEEFIKQKKFEIGATPRQREYMSVCASSSPSPNMSKGMWISVYFRSIHGN